MKFLRNPVAAFLAFFLGIFGLAGSASAAIPDTVTAAITAAGTDAATIGAAVLLVIIGIWAFKAIRRAL